jgi:hypothetical protein
LFSGQPSTAAPSTLAFDTLFNINNSNKAAYSISGSCIENTNTVSISINSGTITDSTVCTSNAFSFTLDMQSILDAASVGIVITEGSDSVSDTTVKDTQLPAISTNTITANTYNSSEVVGLSINFDENVFVTNNPRIEIQMENQSSVNLYLAYVSGSGTNQLNFSYTVADGDGDINGVALTPSINTALGSIADAKGNALVDTLTTTAFAGVLIDTAVPTITSFIEPVNATYADGGGELSFQVNFSEAVDITGLPRLSINIGGVTKYANYSSGTGSTGLEFKYTILAGDDDSDGITLNTNSIDTNGGSILANSDSNAANLAFTSFVDSMSAVIVNTSSGITAPNQVTGVSTAPTTSNTALSLAWSTPGDNGTAIVNYSIQYRTQGSSSWINIPAVSSTTANVSGLIAGTTYEFRVAANNGLLGPYSAISNAEIFDILSLNPIAWLSATNTTNGGVEPIDGSKVTVWKDLTGTATDATEADPAKQPTYETNVQNGLPAVKFDGTLDRGLEGSFTRTNNGGLTIFVVGKFSGTARRAFFEFYKTGGGTSPGSPRGFFFTYGFNNASVNYNLDNTQFNVWSAYDTGTNTDFWENGNLVYSNFGNWGNTSFTGSGTYVLGDDQTGGDRLNGHIGEFLVFDRALTAGEKTTLETYLKNKWGTP